MRLRLLDRYVLSELLYPFIFGIASFSSIFIASSMLYRITQYMTKYGASWDSVAWLFFYSLPEVINYTFPMSMLLASLMAFGKLSGSSEIIAMKSGGISYYRIVAPVLIVAFIVSMFSVVWAEKVVPASKVQYTRVLEYQIKKNTKPKTQDNVIIKTMSGDTQRLTYARRFEEESGRMMDITIEEFDNHKLARIQTAKEGRWENGSWRLIDGTVYSVHDEAGLQSTAKFDEQIIPLDIAPEQISWEQKEPEEMTIRELREYIHMLEMQDQPTARHWREIYMRIFILLLCHDRRAAGNAETAHKFVHRPGAEHYSYFYLLRNNDLYNGPWQRRGNESFSGLRTAEHYLPDGRYLSFTAEKCVKAMG